MAAHGLDRGIRALDLFVAPDPEKIERLRDRDDGDRLARTFGFDRDESLRMPVTRHRDVEDMPGPSRASSALEGLAAACAASSLPRAFGHDRRAPRGVRRFRSIEEADAHRQGWESAGADGRTLER